MGVAYETRRLGEWISRFRLECLTECGAGCQPAMKTAGRLATCPTPFSRKIGDLLLTDWPGETIVRPPTKIHCCKARDACASIRLAGAADLFVDFVRLPLDGADRARLVLEALSEPDHHARSRPARGRLD